MSNFQDHIGVRVILKQAAWFSKRKGGQSGVIVEIETTSDGRYKYHVVKLDNETTIRIDGNCLIRDI